MKMEKVSGQDIPLGPPLVGWLFMFAMASQYEPIQDQLMKVHIYFTVLMTRLLWKQTHTEMNVPHLPGSSQSSQADAMINQHTAQTASNINHRP